IAVVPQACQVHAPAMFGFDEAGQPVKWPKVVVGVDRGNGVEIGSDPLAGSRGTRSGRRGQRRGQKACKNSKKETNLRHDLGFAAASGFKLQTKLHFRRETKAIPLEFGMDK